MYPDYPDNFIYPTYKKSKLEELRGHKVVPIILHVQFAVDRSNLLNVHCTGSGQKSFPSNQFLLFIISDFRAEK